MNARHRRGIVSGALALLSTAALGGLLASGQGGPPRGGGAFVPAELHARAERDGRVRVIAELRLTQGYAAEPTLPPQAAAAQRRAIEQASARVATRAVQASGRVVRRYQTVPFVALEVTPAGLAVLQSSADVVRVMEDALLTNGLAASAPHVQADQAWDVGHDGEGTVLAVLDTGVDAAHPFLAGRVVEEACFSTTVEGLSRSVCPNGFDAQFGSGAAAPCALGDCLHGTHVAGIAAGNGTTGGVPFSGVARGARVMAVQVFSEIIDPTRCSTGVAPCPAAFTTDVVAALEYVYTRRGFHNLAAVNMSLSGGLFTAACDTEPYKPAIDNLRAAGVATIVASGNAGSPWSIGTPACITTAVSVAAVTASDTVSWFSNVAPMLSLFAPGEGITASVPGGGYLPLSGTSMAAPHVAGAWAILREAHPGASVDTLLSALRDTGLPVSDTRFFGSTTAPRIRTLQALASLGPVVSPAPVVSGVSPSRVRAGQTGVTFTIAGSGFNAYSSALWNGAPRPATIVNSGQMRVAIAPSELTVGQSQIAVFTPAPGGGTSAAATITIDPPPTLSVSTTTASTGAPVTVTLVNGAGGPRDWLALAASGASHNQYLQWIYVGEGVTTRTWTVTMPSTVGTYEFRLFLTGTSTVPAATSPAVTLTAAANPVPSISSLSPASALAGGAAFTLTVNGTGFVSSSVVRWNGVERPTTFHGSTQLRASIAAGDIANTGSAAVTVFSPGPGGGVSGSATFSIGTAPTLAVSATTVPTNSNVTVTLTNGLGGNGDWLAFAPTGAANTSYLKYTYVGGGVTTRTWTVTTPLTTGTYEFRLFAGAFTRVATSPTITVVAGTNPVPVLSSISPVAGVVGSDALTITATGTGFTPSSVVRWNGSDRPTTFVSTTQLRATIAASDLTTQGSAQVTVFSPAPGGGTSAARTFSIGPAPVLAVSATSVSPGANVTVTLTNGLGGQGDWIALAATGAPNNSYIRYAYLASGATTGTWTFTMPTTPGTYEFRLFVNNGYTRVATSPTVTVGGQ